MTHQITTSDIISQKLDHINYLRDDSVHNALFVGFARDACYTANNSLSFKKKQLADVLAEYDRHVAEKEDNQAERSGQFAARLHLELEILEERLDIEKAVYCIITDGEEWSPAQKREIKRKTVDIASFRKSVA